MKIIEKNNMFLLILLALIVRILTVIFVGKIPCMEPTYLQLGEDIFFDRVEVIGYSPFYSVVIYFLTNITGDLFKASATVYIFGGIIINLYIFLIGKLIYDETTARIALLVSMVFPCISIAVVGYSHSVILAAAFEIMAVYYFLLFLKDKKIFFAFLVISLTILSIMTRAEVLIVVVPFIFIVSLLRLYEKNVGFCGEHRFQENNIPVQQGSDTLSPAPSKLGVGFNENNKRIVVFLLILAGSIVFFALAHKDFVQKHSHDKTYAGVFADKRYSYITFVTTYSLREYGAYSTETILDISIPFVGTPESNNFSILSTILKYPSQFISNVLFNAKELLDNLAHPLFIPFYFYVFVGLIFAKNNPRTEIQTASLLVLLAIFHAIPLLIFHVEIRYMSAVGIILIFLLSRGIFYMENKKLASVIILPVTLAIYLAYVYKFSRPIFNMCVL